MFVELPSTSECSHRTTCLGTSLLKIPGASCGEERGAPSWGVVFDLVGSHPDVVTGLGAKSLGATLCFPLPSLNIYGLGKGICCWKQGCVYRQLSLAVE